MKAESMYICLNGLKLHARHGVLPQEQAVGAEYTIDLRLATDFTQAAATDRLEGTINYAEVFEVVKAEMAVASQLLEHVVQRIAHHLFDSFAGVSEIEIALYKQNPPMGAQCDRVGVEVKYTR